MVKTVQDHGTIEENILFGSIKDKAKAIVTLLDQSVGSCLVLAFGYTLLQDPFSWRNIMGILLAMVGMILYSYYCKMYWTCIRQMTVKFLQCLVLNSVQNLLEYCFFLNLLPNTYHFHSHYPF